MPLSAGDTIGSFTLADQNGRHYTFPDDFNTGATAIFFLRHLGCPLCKDKLFELKSAAGRFEQKSVKLIAVVQSTPARAARVAARQGFGFMLVPDREKKLYAMFELRRGGLKEFAAPAAFAATVRATLKGRLHGRFEGDEFQVPAAFLLSPAGEVLYAHYGRDVSDFGSVDELLARA